MTTKHGENYLPWATRGKPLKIRTPDEIKHMILNSHHVKEVIAKIAREKAK